MKAEHPLLSLQVNTLLSYPRLREFYEQIRAFRGISITNVALRCLPEDLSLQDTLNWTEMHSPLVTLTETLRYRTTLLLHPFLWEQTRGLDYSAALALIGNPVNREQINVMLSADYGPPVNTFS